jgi:glycerophosphoryl diester phosphodiesterase
VPTLAAALDTIQAGSKALIERKDGSAEAHAKVLVEKKLVNRLIVQCFDWAFLADLHKRLPEQVLWALGSKELDDARLEKLVASGATAAAWEHAEITAAFVKRLKARGLKVVAWTADKPEDWQRLTDAGVEGIITNKPRELRAWLEQPGGPSPTEKPRQPRD